MKTYYVYMLSNKKRGTIYIGITSNLEKRLAEHRSSIGSIFVKKYKLYKLVYAESTNDVNSAISREKHLKNWHRDWKINLIESINPEWNDLSIEIFGNMDAEPSSA